MTPDDTDATGTDASTGRPGDGERESRVPDDETDSRLPSFDRRRLRESVDRTELRTVLKVLLGAGALAFVLGLASLLPGADRLVPLAPFAWLDVLVAAGTLAVVAALLEVAPRVGRIVRRALDGPDAVVRRLARVATLLVVLVAVLVGYRGLDGVAVPVLAGADAVWLYDLAFLLAGAVPVALIGVALYRALDPAADELVDAITGGREGAAHDGRGEEST